MYDCDVLIFSSCVFDSVHPEPFDGFVAVHNRRIVAVGSRADAVVYEKTAKRVVDAGDRTVMPGLVDVHTFFTGWYLRQFGPDVSGCQTAESVAEVLLGGLEEQARDGQPALVGHGVLSALCDAKGQEAFNASMERVAPGVPAVAFTADGGTCLMNAAARETWGFTPDACYAERIWRLLEWLLGRPEAVDAYQRYQAMLNARGVTAIKEMCFDTYAGFADTMAAAEKNHELTLRVSMMSQPVAEGANLAYALAARERHTGDFVRFSGFNRMTDRGIASFLGELKQPYKSRPDICVAEPPEWELIESEVRAADAAGFRFSLHCQGDGAVAHTVSLYDTLPKDKNGRLLRRHAITDLEYSDPVDLELFGAMGGICEVYPQIQSLDAKADIVEMVDRQLGLERMQNYWNRRQMLEAGCNLCCGTDLPLLLPSLGESLYCGVGGYFDDGGYACRQNMVTTAQMLTAWTAGGAYDLEREADFGTLEPGKFADVCALSANVFELEPQDARSVTAVLTLSDGRIVFDTLTK